MKSLPFLWEIGCEEIPAGWLPGLLEQLKAKFSSELEKAGLGVVPVEVYGTLRRLVVNVGKHQGVFVTMMKMLPTGDDGKLKRHQVLGLVKWDGSETAIAKGCSANTFKCTYATQVTRTVVCEEA